MRGHSILCNFKGGFLGALAVDFLQDGILETRFVHTGLEAFDAQTAVFKRGQSDDDDFGIDVVGLCILGEPQARFFAARLVVDADIGLRAFNDVGLGDNRNVCFLGFGDNVGKSLDVNGRNDENVPRLR